MRRAPHVISSLFACCCFVLVLAPTASAQVGLKEPPGQSPSPASTPRGEPQFQSRISGDVVVGELAPDFELDASDGRHLQLSTMRGRWVILVFGDRKETVAPMARVAASLDSSGIALVGVCNEKTYFLASYVKHTRFPFPILSDVTREISAMYGLDDPRERSVQPGFVMIEPRGNVRFALLGETLPPDDVARLARFVVARP